MLPFPCLLIQKIGVICKRYFFLISSGEFIVKHSPCALDCVQYLQAQVRVHRSHPILSQGKASGCSHSAHAPLIMEAKTLKAISDLSPSTRYPPPLFNLVPWRFATGSVAGITCSFRLKNLSISITCWKREIESAPFSFPFTLHPNTTSVRFHNSFGDCESQSHPL